MTAPLDALRALHARIDAEAARLTALHADRLKCGLGCTDCCIDDLTVTAVEAARIRADFPELLATGTPASPGRCAFLSDTGACRIYAARPYVCRTQGLPLRWYAEDQDGDIIEERDICPLNITDEAIDLLPEDACWQLGVVEMELMGIDGDFGGGERVGLRGLFG